MTVDQASPFATALRFFALIVVAAVAVTAGHALAPAADKSPKDSTWEDQDPKEFTEKERLADRPGNFEVARKVGMFFEGAYQVEPQVPDIAFPYNDNGRRIESAEAAAIREQRRDSQLRESGRKQQNKLRQYNIVLHKLTFVNLAKGETKVPNADALGFAQQERLNEVRKDHPERCCLVLIRAGLESLESAKIEGNQTDSDFVLCYVLKGGEWKVVWFEK